MRAALVALVPFGAVYTVRLEDRELDLSRLRSLDLCLIYWGSPLIAHTIMSWGFDGDQYLAISIETRKEVRSRRVLLVTITERLARSLTWVPKDDFRPQARISRRPPRRVRSRHLRDHVAADAIGTEMEFELQEDGR